VFAGERMISKSSYLKSQLYHLLCLLTWRSLECLLFLVDQCSLAGLVELKLLFGEISTLFNKFLIRKLQYKLLSRESL
jgi:hypothetical protein